jgi:hypothetical protein
MLGVLYLAIQFDSFMVFNGLYVADEEMAGEAYNVFIIVMS